MTFYALTGIFSELASCNNQTGDQKKLDIMFFFEIHPSKKVRPTEWQYYRQVS